MKPLLPTPFRLESRHLVTNIFALLFWLIPVMAQAQLDFSGGVVGQQLDKPLVTAQSLLSITSAKAGSLYRAAVVVEIAQSWHINSANPLQGYLIPAEVEFDSTAQFQPRSLAYPGSEETTLAGEVMSVYSGRAVIMFDVAVNANVTAGEYTLPVRFTYQPCNNKECRAPQTLDVGLKIVVGDEGTPINSDIFGSSTTTAPDSKRTQTIADTNDMQRLIDRYGIWGYFIALGLAFVTGLLLSFSPCTYPMIPITVSIFAGQQRSIGKGFVLSLFYVGSMAAVYGIMGLIVASVGGVFGAWLASTPVVIGITVVFVIFALSMFGLYELQVPAWLRQRLGARASAGGVGGSIILGVVAALVVSPCVGPFVAGILLYIATSGSPLIGFAVLFVFALGLGTLYVIVGTFSSAINALPGSGMWMEAVKKFFGYVLLLMAVFFLRAIVPTTITAIATGLILIAFAVFWGGLDRLTGESKFFPRLKKFLGIVALIVATYLLLGALIQSGLILPPLQELLPSGSGQTGENEPDLIAWQSDLEQGLQQARTAGRPVLIDTWATWCANCRVLDKKTFHNVQVAAEARRFLPIKVQLEKSDSPITKDFMTRFGLKFYSLPTTLLIDSSGKVQRIMQGVVEPAEMLTEMRKVN
jgi:thiol:disulfide interchange protein DsbD